jgi:hypothetical protein
MEIRIKTKFSLQDKPYAYFKGKIWQFIINAIKVNYNSSNSYDIVFYECTSINPEEYGYDEDTFTHTFAENELHTKEELTKMVNNL